MQTDAPYVPIVVRLLYGDLIASPLEEKRARAAELLAQYPQLAQPASSPPASYRSRIPTDPRELDFETTHLVPALQRAGIRYTRQHPIAVRVGRNLYHGRIDFYLYDDAGILSIIESKRSIADDSERAEAVAQAKSYALPLGAPSFLIAAPQGIWLYTLRRHHEHLMHTYTLAQFARTTRHLPEILASYR